MPGETQYALFDGLPKNIYEEASPRFVLGNDPVPDYLEGCYVLLKDNEPTGRFAFYENPALKYKDVAAACMGSYECVNDKDVSEKLMEYATALARGKGYGWLIGPMEGSTWNNYRFSLHNNYTNFFMEPYHHLYYNEQWINAGFETIADYYSNRHPAYDYNKAALDETEKHYLEKGAVFREMNMDNFDNELRQIAQLSVSNFAQNFLYTPISIDEFVGKYERLKNLFDPRLITVAEDKDGVIQAFIFNIKDYTDASGKTMIVKTIVRDQSSPLRGIAGYLVGRSGYAAREMGYEKVIHAFMIGDNPSLNISKRYAVEEYQYKEYALYGLKL